MTGLLVGASVVTMFILSVGIPGFVQVEGIILTRKEFETAVEEAKTGDEVYIKAGSLKLRQPVVIDKSISLIGTHSTMICSPETPTAFVILSSGVKLTDIFLENCSESAIQIDLTRTKTRPIETSVSRSAKAKLTKASVMKPIMMKNVQFRNNIADRVFSRGGGLSIVGCSIGRCNDHSMDIKPVDVILKSCTFENNSAEIGGGIYAENANLTIINNHFTNNDATFLGGGIHIRGHSSILTIERTNFQRNKVTRMGRHRAVFLKDGRPLEPFQYFRFPFTGSHGGAIDIRSVKETTISDTTLFHNRAPSGGAVSMEFHWMLTHADIQVTDCRFENNTAAVDDIEGSIGDGLLGGAVYLVSSTQTIDWILKGSTFKDNSASHGGALHVAALLSRPSRIEDTLFEDNLAEGFGGAMVLRNTAVDVKASVFRDNVAKIGGGVFVTNNGMLKGIGLAGLPPDSRQGTPITFARNRAENGGGLACIACGDIVLQDVQFLENEAESQGGGVYVFDTAGSISCTQCQFEDNTGIKGGGAAIEAAADVGFSSAESSLKTRFKKNVASLGSALHYVGNRLKMNRLRLVDFEVLENKGRSEGSRSGGTVRLVLDGIPVSADGDIQFEDVLIESNVAAFAGTSP